MGKQWNGSTVAEACGDILLRRYLLNVTLPIIGTPSRTEDGARCHRRHVISAVLCLERRGADNVNTTTGTVIHDIAAANWRGGDVVQAAGASFERNATVLSGGEFGPGAFEAIATGYAEQAVLAGDALFAKLPGWQVEVCEKRIVLDLDPRARLSFQLDRLAHNPEHGMWSLVDTKSHKPQTAYRRREWEERFFFSLQQKIYRWVAIREWGIAPEKLEHFIEGVSKQVPTTVSYVRLPAWTMGELEEAKERLVRICQQDAELVARATEMDGTVNVDRLLAIALSSETDFNPDACMAFHTRCPLWDVCRAPVEQRVGLVHSDFEHVDPIFLD